MAVFPIYEKKKCQQNKWAKVLIRQNPFSALSHLHLCISHCVILCASERWGSISWKRAPSTSLRFSSKPRKSTLEFWSWYLLDFTRRCQRKIFFAKNKGLSTIVLKCFAMETRRGPGPGSVSRYTSVCYVSAMSVANGISKIHPLFEQVNHFGGECFVFVKQQQQQKTSEKTDELHVSASTISRNSLCWLGFANSNHMSQAGNWVKWERRCCSEHGDSRAVILQGGPRPAAWNPTWATRFYGTENSLTHLYKMLLVWRRSNCGLKG